MNNNLTLSSNNKKISRRYLLKAAAGAAVAAPYFMRCKGDSINKAGVKRIIRTDSAPKPVGPYSQAIEAGEFVFLSGQIPIDAKTNQLDKGDIKSQTKIVLENISEILKAAGLTMRDVVKTTVFLDDMNDFSGMNEVYSEYFSEGKPARSTVQVVKLALGVKIEIDAIAVKNGWYF